MSHVDQLQELLCGAPLGEPYFIEITAPYALSAWIYATSPADAWARINRYAFARGEWDGDMQIFVKMARVDVPSPPNSQRAPCGFHEILDPISAFVYTHGCFLDVRNPADIPSGYDSFGALVRDDDDDDDEEEETCHGCGKVDCECCSTCENADCQCCSDCDHYPCTCCSECGKVYCECSA